MTGHVPAVFGLNEKSQTLLHVALENQLFTTALSLIRSMGTLSSASGNHSTAPKRSSGLDLQDNNGSTPLLLAVRSNHLATVNALLEHGVSITTSDNDGNSALSLAARFGYLDIFIQLLAYKTDALSTANKHILLCEAAEHGQDQILKHLLQEWPPTEQSESIIHAAMLHASGRGQTEAIQLFLDHYKPQNYRDFAFRAVERGHPETLCYFLDGKVNRNASDGSDEGNRLLHCAVKSNDPQMVSALLSKGAFVDVINSADETPLFIEAAKGFSDILDILLEKHARPHISNRWGEAPIVAAASKGHYDIVKILLKHGVTVLDHQWKWILKFAITEWKFDVFSIIISHIAPLDEAKAQITYRKLQDFFYKERNGDDTLKRIEVLMDHNIDVEPDIGPLGGLLHYAVCWGNFKLVELLLRPRQGIKVDIDKMNMRYETPLQLAAGEWYPGSLEMVGLLLSKGAQPRPANAQLGLPIHAAANLSRCGLLNKIRNEAKSLKIVKLLLQLDPDSRHAVSTLYGTVLQAAARAGYLSVMELLISEGLEKNVDGVIPVGRYGTPLHALLSRNIGDPSQMMKLLLATEELMLGPETRDQEGRLPIHIAAMTNNVTIFKKLSGEGSLISTKDYQGRSALHLAAANGANSVIEHILSTHKELIHDEDDDGWTALHWACRQEIKKTVKLLLANGADPIRPTNRGWLPQDVAVWHDKDYSFGKPCLWLESSKRHGPGIAIETAERICNAGWLAGWELRPDVVLPVCDSCHCVSMTRLFPTRRITN